MTDKTILPKNWRVARFFELLDYKQPTNYIVESTEYHDNYKTPVLTAGKSFIIGYTNEREGIFNTLPVIIFDDFTTATQFVNFPFKVKSSAMKILYPKDEYVNIKFVFYFMQTVRIKSETHKRYWISEYSRIPIPRPPFSEQQQIVSKIEELFSELDKGKQQLETVKLQLKTYRQAVLKWAFEGRFTSINKSAAGTSRDLSRSSDNLKSLPEGWKWVKLKDVCHKIQDGSHFSPQTQYIESGENRYKYITAKNIRNNYMDLSNIKFVDKEFHDSIFNRCNPEFGDVLLTKDGVNTGEVTLNTLKEEFSLLSSVCIFKTDKCLLRGDFLKYFIQSPFGIKIIEESMTGTAIKRIILRKIKEAEILIPPLVEQSQIVQEIETRLSVCDKMEETIENSLRQVESLRQSILKQAFEGKLV